MNCVLNKNKKSFKRFSDLKTNDIFRFAESTTNTFLLRTNTNDVGCWVNLSTGNISLNDCTLHDDRFVILLKQIQPTVFEEE